MKRKKNPKRQPSHQQANVKTDKETNEKIVARYRKVRRMMNLLLILSGICVAIAAMVGIFAHSRDGAIWFTCAGVVFAVIAGFAWFQGTVWDNDINAHATPPNKLDSSPSPTLTPSPTPLPSETAHESVAPSEAPRVEKTPTATPTPTPETDSPHVSEMTPEEVGRKLEKAKERGDSRNVRKALVLMIVDWKLLYWSARYTDDNKRVSAFFVWRDVSANAAVTDLMVSFEVPMSGHERLPLEDRYVEYRTEGVIEEVNDLDIVHLKDVRLTKIKPSNTPAPMKDERPNINITSHGQKGGFTGINEGTVNVRPANRHLTAEQQKIFVSKMRAAAGKRARVTFAPGDREAENFANQLESLLREAGLEVTTTPRTVLSFGTGLWTGVGVNETVPTAELFAETLGSFDIEVIKARSTTKPPEDVLEVIVKQRP